ncbi:two component sensor kinase [Mycobacterium haemophilum DSM 44634]|uniref:sensor histidine kinase n=1 Tax=Mycobacterium haemophilum TaxID=29311 RepID=UPI0006556283|nr:ATP-binding protein [Mycobacterium haemophilum]AKN17926.1 histidine kinase [Mycobacterium haemophilum DSM 44634]MCV7340622.1 ATP-binding protein [Mycobacterium haemophilum DSM 44634]
MSSTDVEQVRSKHRLRSLRAGSALRVGVVIIMIGAMLIAPDPTRWPEQAVLLGVYACVAMCALIVAFSTASHSFAGESSLLILALVDVAAVFGFKLLSAGGYIPLMVMALLPRMVAVDMSWQRAAAVLACTFGVFSASVLQDPVIARRLGVAETALILLMYGFVCCTALLVVLFRLRHVDEMAKLTTSREELLAQTMTASEAERRQISESIHDGPLQDVLAARRDIVDFLKTSPAAALECALASLEDASRLLREATFELHPAVLDHVGLAAAVQKLAAVTADRSGMAITTDVDYSESNAVDPILFGVIRELLSNVARHSHASTASVVLTVIDGKACVDVTDNGIGITPDVAARHLAEGHIGLASHRARVEAAGGTMSVIDEPVGAHIRVELPLRR